MTVRPEPAASMSAAALRETPTGIALQEEDAREWTYKGEGAANLILSYNGSTPSFLGKVLRIRKVLNECSRLAEKASLSKHEQLIWSDVLSLAVDRSEDALAQSYINHVIRQLLGAAHVDAGIRVSVSRDFLAHAEINIGNQRPAWRVDISKIDIHADSALLISDHSVFPGPGWSIAVEIKPKCGFLPISDYISKETSIKKFVSRYRMHQFMKFHKGEILKTSDYDPLDLFSKSKERIHLAIRALFITPQNNLRVFVNGKLTFGGMGGGTEEICSDHADKIIKDLTPVTGFSLSSLMDLTAEVIYNTNFLNQLLTAQKLDNHDIEGAIHAYYNIIGHPCLACKNTTDVQLLHIYTFLHSLTLEESVKIVRDYLISATAKDCSLMISFKVGANGTGSCRHGSVCLDALNEVFDYKASFIDLDMKPFEKMAYYYKLDQKIVSFYKEDQR